MGCIFSSKPNSPDNSIRVVHLNGCVEDFDSPITAGEVTGKPPKQFLCTQAQLMAGGLKPLQPDTPLEPSHVYFLLSYSTIQSDASPVDIASTARRLTKIAKTSRLQAKSPLTDSFSPRGLRPVCRSPGRCPSRFCGEEMKLGNGISVVGYGLQSSSKGGSWKPILESIREGSFNMRSESDLQEKHLEISK